MGVNRDDLRQGLMTLLREELSLLQQLEALLDEEYQVLSNTDTARLTEVVTHKTHTLQALEARGQARADALRQAGAEPNHEALRTLFADDAEALALLDTFAASARRCQQQNQTHGGIIELSQARIGRILDVLRGTEQTPTYGRSGRSYGATGGGNRNSLGTA